MTRGVCKGCLKLQLILVVAPSVVDEVQTDDVCASSQIRTPKSDSRTMWHRHCGRILRPGRWRYEERILVLDMGRSESVIDVLTATGSRRALIGAALAGAL